MSWLLRCSLLLCLFTVAWAQEPAVSPSSSLRVFRNAPIDIQGPRAMAKEIKSSPLYRDAGVEESSNWLARALEKLKNLFRPQEQKEMPDIRLPAWLGAWLNVFMWLLLGTAVAIFAFYAIKHFLWRQSLRRQATAIVEEDEPDRTADEWLRLADQFESEGDFRRAVRSLYLACLLRFDEARIARFDRGQTNWEHLVRIHGSPRKPAQLDFTPPTKAFDRIWYGRVVRGKEDVQDFRATYQLVQNLTRAVTA